MKKIKYFLQFIFICFLFFVFKIIGLNFARVLSGFIVSHIGPIFRSNKIIFSNLSKAFPEMTESEKKNISKKMWVNYGKILSEYMFMKNFRYGSRNLPTMEIENQQILRDIETSKKPAIFISGHFNNFELMAMQIEKLGIDLVAVYRPLNNIFLNPLMEKIRKNYICKNQIKKGISGTKQLLQSFKSGKSIALMIDQRVSQGIRSKFFNDNALTTTIPAQFVKKYNTNIIPVYIERAKLNCFKFKFYEPINFSKDSSIELITEELNKVIEKMIKKNPDQWIWTHDRWK
tara:strand:+ start:462 stop:1325 length:864 start_codon:yes stop_codon:yes gene_type:complete